MQSHFHSILLAIEIFEKEKPEEDDFVYIPWRKRPKPVDYQEKRISVNADLSSVNIRKSDKVGHSLAIGIRIGTIPDIKSHMAILSQLLSIIGRILTCDSYHMTQMIRVIWYRRIIKIR